jgi:hypothetical protein
MLKLSLDVPSLLHILIQRLTSGFQGFYAFDFHEVIVETDVSRGHFRKISQIHISQSSTIACIV